jgi:hypothetical protein
MATNPNATQITPPRVPIIDTRTGAVSREWYRWFYSLYNIVGGGLGVVPVASGGTGLSTIPTNGQLLIGNGTGYSLNTLGVGAGISATNGSGTITLTNTGVLSNIAGSGISVSSATGNVSINNTGVLSFSGGTTGLTPATATTGVVTLAGTLAIASGGTNGSSTPTAGAVPYGTGTAYAFTVAGSVGQVLTSAGAGVPTWTTPTTGTITSVSFTGGIISVATPTTTPALTVAGTSGGVVYFSNGTTWASSAALTANALVVGGGAGVAPSTVTTGTGVVTALGVNTGTAGAFVVNGGALGTPSSGTVTNLTGTASININGTVGATTPAAGAFTSISDSGNLTFTGTSNRITGDFSNSTAASRLALQTSTTDGNTLVNVLPNGTSNVSRFRAFNTSDPTNSSFGDFGVSSTQIIIQSSIQGTGTYLPMTFYTNGSEQMRITTAGGVSFGSSGTAYGTSGQVLISAGNAPPTWTSTASININGTVGATTPAAGTFNPLTLSATPSSNWGIDFAPSTSSPNYVTLAAAATYDIAAGSGLVVIHNNTNGDAALFLTYGGVVVKIGGAASIVSGTGILNQIGLVYNGGAAKYRINNGYLTSQSVFVTTIRTRTSS